MSTLTTPNAQSLNFRFKIKWSTIEWPITKEKLLKGHLERENRKTQELARKRQPASRTKWKCNEKLSTSPTFLNACSPLLVEFIMFLQTSLNHPVSKRVLPLYFVHILSPFGNELIKYKPRGVDAMHEIKIRVLHILYQQIFKPIMLNKMSRLCKNES
jgi:hypothetical protein